MTKWLIIALFFTAHDLVCWGQDSVDQPSREETSAEGNQVTLLCNYTLMSAANAYLFWYKQLPNRSPTFILSEFSIGKGKTESEFEERFLAKLDSTLGSVPLMIQDVCVSDSAVYYCALNPFGANKIIFGEGTMLHVEAKDKKKADVYKLEDNSCLATDYTDHKEVNFTNLTPVRYSGEKYQNFYSIFALNAEQGCNVTDGCKGGSSGQIDMEFDEKINFMSLGLFWLRILLLKTVVFNILMTFKAWMS